MASIPTCPDQNPNSVWSYGTGKYRHAARLPPPLIKGRYGEPILTRIYNNMPADRTQNGGFGRNETSVAFPQRPQRRGKRRRLQRAPLPRHLLRLSLEHDAGPARQDQHRAPPTRGPPGPTATAASINVAGDFRELQGTMWAHDHRFFFTAENVYKGNVHDGELLQRARSRQRGARPTASICGCRAAACSTGATSISTSTWSSPTRATDPNGQLFFDIFTTDGFLGDLPLRQLRRTPRSWRCCRRKYRFRILNACMSRFIKLALSLELDGGAVPVHRQRRQLGGQPDRR